MTGPSLYWILAGILAAYAAFFRFLWWMTKDNRTECDGCAISPDPWDQERYYVRAVDETTAQIWRRDKLMLTITGEEAHLAAQQTVDDLNWGWDDAS